MIYIIVVSDIHGNYPLYMKYKELWEDEIIFLGDVIDCNGDYPDQSTEILDDIKSEKKSKGFKVLCGNHEASNWVGGYMFENNSLLVNHFKQNIRGRNSGVLQPFYDEYVSLMQEFPLYHVTCNGCFLSHAGPPRIAQELGFLSLTWNYMDEVNEVDISSFLEENSLKTMAVGHNHPKNYKIKHKMLTFNSGNGYYLDINEEVFMDIMYLENCVKRLEDVESVF